MEAEGHREEQKPNETLRGRTDYQRPDSHRKPKAAVFTGNVRPPLPSTGKETILSMMGPHHRRAQSEAALRLPEDLDIASSDTHSSGFEEFGTEDDLFSAFMDIEKIYGNLEAGVSRIGGNANFRNCLATFEEIGQKQDNVGGNAESDRSNIKPNHRYSNSVDSSIMFSAGCRIDVIEEAKKAMPAEKLAELTASDPKRAKRIVANRQSAARSKERKARYMSDLEHKVQSLQTEATSLSARITLFQRDIRSLTSENSELKIRYQGMEKQVQLSDAFNKALQQEVDRLKTVTWETLISNETFKADLHHVAYNTSSMAASFPNLQGQSDIFLQQDIFGNFHGLEVKSSSPSISATESSSTL